MKIPLLYTVGFISSVYIWKQIKKMLKLESNAKLKTLSVAVSVLLMILNQSYLIGNCQSIMECLNLNITVNSILYPIICNTLLFLGPIYNNILENPFEKRSFLDSLSENPFKNDRLMIRIIFAPLLEEIAFRALFYQNFDDQNEYRLISSILFSLAHAHKFFSFFKKERKYRTALYKITNKYQYIKACFIKSFLRTLFILMFTFIFGYYAASVFLKTSSLISVIILHSYCNYLGFPNFKSIFQNNKSNAIKILSMYVVGVVSFYYFITM